MLSAQLAPSESVKQSTANIEYAPPQQHLRPSQQIEPLYENINQQHHSLQKHHTPQSYNDHQPQHLEGHYNDNHQQQQQYYHQQQQLHGSRNSTMDNRSVTSGDNNYSDIDGREKKHSKLSKFLGRKSKMSS